MFCMVIFVSICIRTFFVRFLVCTVEFVLVFSIVIVVCGFRSWLFYCVKISRLDLGRVFRLVTGTLFSVGETVFGGNKILGKGRFGGECLGFLAFMIIVFRDYTGIVCFRVGFECVFELVFFFVFRRGEVFFGRKFIIFLLVVVSLGYI